MGSFVYILYSSKTDKYYIGSTNDPIRRLKDHNYGNTTSTKSGRPWQISYCQEFNNMEVAKKIEKKLKKFKSRKILDGIVSAQNINLNG